MKSKGDKLQELEAESAILESLYAKVRLRIAGVEREYREPKHLHKINIPLRQGRTLFSPGPIALGDDLEVSGIRLGKIIGEVFGVSNYKLIVVDDNQVGYRVEPQKEKISISLFGNSRKILLSAAEKGIEAGKK
jgi:hypothetical protein